jgi:hypothetical protein
MKKNIFSSGTFKGFLVVGIVIFGLSRCGNDNSDTALRMPSASPSSSHSPYNPYADLDSLKWTYVCIEPDNAFINKVDLNLFERKLLNPEDFSSSLLEIGKHGISAEADAKEYYEKHGDSSAKILGEEYGKFGVWVLTQRMQIQTLTVDDIKEIDRQYQDLKNQAKVICEKL